MTIGGHIKLNDADKFIIRKAVLELAKRGTPRFTSIDDDVRNLPKVNSKAINLWDYVTAIGAQLSRPSYDPYRETISLDISIGRKRSRKVTLNIPFIIYGNIAIEYSSLESVHVALNRLAEQGNVLGLISEIEINMTEDKRKYPLFKKVPFYIKDSLEDFKKSSSEGLVLEYKDESSLKMLQNYRKEFDGPILVDVSDVFPLYIKTILEEGADGIIVDTEKVTKKNERYRGKHAIAVIYDARNAINDYYIGREEKNDDDDNAILVVAGDVNSAGKIVKAAALGANVVGYSTSMLIAHSHMYSEKPADISSIAENVYRHMIGTKGEIKGIPAALGYSDFHNLSPSDLRTSSIQASIQGDIPIEGIDRTYIEMIEEVINEYVSETGIKLDSSQTQEVLRSLVREK
ncbi:MAG: glutamate synthase-related protein [Nitrososphaeraceae archaeon]